VRALLAHAMDELTAPISDQFGFLPIDYEMTFNGWRVRPLDDFVKKKEQLTAWGNRDGYLYPAQSWLETEDGDRISATDRPQRMFRLFASHTLSTDSHQSNEELRQHESAFIMHFLGVLFGFRLQFHDWWFDGRVPVKSMHNLSIRPRVANHCVARCHKMWLGWPKEIQRWMTNLLYMHSRGPMYEWDWESFMIEYMVLDGCIGIATKVSGFHKHAHGDPKPHLEALCEHFGMAVNNGLLKAMKKLRNQLFHESLWAGGQPCASPSGEVFMLPRYLHGLNHRLLLSLLAYRNSFTADAWWSFSVSAFGIPGAP
jgi:hypothetical protein